MPWSHPLGLRKHEWEAIRNCMWARTQVDSGYFLASPNRVASSRRMVTHGFLTEVDPVKGSGGNWPVFKITPENIAAYNTALRAATDTPAVAQGGSAACR